LRHGGGGVAIVREEVHHVGLVSGCIEEREGGKELKNEGGKKKNISTKFMKNEK
jgi:hypothetical protein